MAKPVHTRKAPSEWDVPPQRGEYDWMLRQQPLPPPPEPPRPTYVRVEKRSSTGSLRSLAATASGHSFCG